MIVGCYTLDLYCDDPGHVSNPVDFRDAVHGRARVHGSDEGTTRWLADPGRKGRVSEVSRAVGDGWVI